VSQCTVLIAAPELLPLLTHAHTDDGELIVFSDADMSKAVETISERRPNIVAVEQIFASTPRGTAFIGRITADPALSECEVRIVAHGGGHRVVSSSRNVAPPTDAPPLPLDARGTRRAQRFRISGPLETMVDGNPASLVDLSSLGAQVLSATVLKPNQRVRMSLSDEHGTTRFNATVAWSAFEIPPKSAPRYRAGVEFLDVDHRIVSGYCLKYQVA
jgi:hypothetical protein